MQSHIRARFARARCRRVRARLKRARAATTVANCYRMHRVRVCLHQIGLIRRLETIPFCKENAVTESAYKMDMTKTNFDNFCQSEREMPVSFKGDLYCSPEGRVNA